MTSQPRMTRVVELTPPGRAAVAVVRVEGPTATADVNACIHRGDRKRLADTDIGRILVAHWGSPNGEEVVVCRRSETAVEIHCHGGTAAVQAVISLLVDRGCQAVHWKDWVRDTVGDPIQAAAQIALAEALTPRTAAILFDQYAGALRRAIEATVDAATESDWPTVVARLEAILVHRDVGLHLTKPWRVVLAGRPNVGKSSLLNALVGFERAIVCDLPGTTRDVVTASTAIDGWPVLIADTAGLRDAESQIESEGVERAAVAAGGADLVLWVDDGQSAESYESPVAKRLMKVRNKIDLPAVAGLGRPATFAASTNALTGAGIAELVTAIGVALVPVAPVPGAAVPFTEEQIGRIEAALAAARHEDAAATDACLGSVLRS